MKTKLITLVISSLCLSGLASTVYAEGAYGQMFSNAYNESANNPPPPPEHKRDRDKLSFKINLDNGRPTFEVKEKHHHYEPPRHHYYNKGPKWIDMMPGYPPPQDAVIGGNEPGRPMPIYVCHASYRTGVHPGKLIDGSCNISWGGREVRLPQYQVLVSRFPLNWVPARYGELPPNAIEGGFENGHPLFVCQAMYNGGMHVGKVIGSSCDIGWGGREVPVPYYNVLVG